MFNQNLPQSVKQDVYFSTVPAAPTIERPDKGDKGNVPTPDYYPPPPPPPPPPPKPENTSASVGVSFLSQAHITHAREPASGL